MFRNDLLGQLFRTRLDETMRCENDLSKSLAVIEWCVFCYFLFCLKDFCEIFVENNLYQFSFNKPLLSRFEYICSSFVIHQLENCSRIDKSCKPNDTEWTLVSSAQSSWQQWIEHHSKIYCPSKSNASSPWGPSQTDRIASFFFFFFCNACCSVDDWMKKVGKH